MINLMIVDDEQIVRDGIKFIVEKEFGEDVKIVAMARTGREAIEKYEEHKPAIVFMDIQMPGINGIDAIRAIKEQNSKVKCIIVSAYEQFEFAKQAVELGVSEYILKPINRRNLMEILEKVIHEIESEKKVKQKEMENQEKIDKILPILENGFIYSILMNTDYASEIDNYHNLFNISKEIGYIMVIEFGEGRIPGELTNKIGTGIKNTNQYDAIRNTIKYKCKCVVGPIIVNRITVLFYEDHMENEYEQRIRAIDLAGTIISSLERIVDSEIYVGIGSRYKIHRVNASYQEATKAISKMTGERILHIKDATNNVDEEQQYIMIKIKSDETLMMKKIEEADYEAVEGCINRIFDRINRTYGEVNNSVKNIIMEMVVLMHTTAYFNNIVEDNISYDSYLDDIKGIENLHKLQAYCLSKAKSITEHIGMEKERKVSNVIYKAKIYIDENYNKEIGLKEVSEAVAISPQYFSKIFKEEIGVNFIDYITKVRINRAKELLNAQTLSIKEIAFEVGYNDPNYFSRLFKKIEGISPTEYK
ncbi:MAG: response regulator [Vallitaleaceae bacterium]|jgi:two-component system response regulator YesN|nr:response regulator [Vallitaleaceae bacterium]